MLFYILYRNYIWTFIFLAAAAIIAAAVYFANRVKIVSLEEMKDSAKKDLLIGLRDNAGAFSDLLEPLFVLASNRSGRKEWVMKSWYDTVHSLDGNEKFKKAFDEKFAELYGEPATELVIDKNSTKAEKKSYKAVKKALKKVGKVASEHKKADKKKATEDKKISKLEAKLSETKRNKKKKKIEKKIAKIQKKDVARNKKFEKAADKLHVKYAQKLVKYLCKAGIVRHTDFSVTADEATSETYDVIGNTSLEKGAVYDVHLPLWSLSVSKREGLEELLAAKDENTEEVKEEAPVPTTRKEKKAAKKAAKKDKKKAKKAAKKDKKLNKKIAKLEKKFSKAKKSKKQIKINKKIASYSKKLSANKALKAKDKALKKAIKALPVETVETLVAKGAVK